MKVEQSHVGLEETAPMLGTPVRVLTKAWSNLDCLMCGELWDVSFALVDAMRAHLVKGKQATVSCPKCDRLHAIVQMPNAVVMGLAVR